MELITDNHENCIMLISETHMKSDNIVIDKNIGTIIKMREQKDKKGGGLMLMYKKGQFNCINEIANKNRDVLTVLVEKGKIRFKIILVYMSVINKRPDDELRNESINKIGMHELPECDSCKSKVFLGCQSWVGILTLGWELSV